MKFERCVDSESKLFLVALTTQGCIQILWLGGHTGLHTDIMARGHTGLHTDIMARGASECFQNVGGGAMMCTIY